MIGPPAFLRPALARDAAVVVASRGVSAPAAAVVQEREMLPGRQVSDGLEYG